MMVRNPFKKQEFVDPALKAFEPDMKRFYESLEYYLSKGKGCLTAKEHYQVLKGKGLTSHEILDSDNKQMQVILRIVCSSMMPKDSGITGLISMTQFGPRMMIGVLEAMRGDLSALKDAVIELLDDLMCGDCGDCKRASYREGY